jgi:protein arginine kinase
MLHLPALEIIGKIEEARQWASTRGHVLRGTFGEGSKSHGSLHQLSNQVTLGVDEADIILAMEKSTLELCQREREARRLLPAKYGTLTRDRMGRALGTLQYARSLSCQEASQCLSLLRLAQEMEWATGFTRQRFNELLVWIRPASIQVSAGHALSGSQRDALRAETLRPFARRIKFTTAFEDAASPISDDSETASPPAP